MASPRRSPDQLNAKNLLSIQGSYTTATSLRDNNTQMYNAFGTRSRGIVLVNGNNPLSGACYDSGGALTSCDPAQNLAQFATWQQAATNSIPAVLQRVAARIHQLEQSADLRHPSRTGRSFG
ncbi:MAG: hypothetical protein ACXVAK_14940, partial [Vulcanimicrobiaceae bacterium]